MDHTSHQAAKQSGSQAAVDADLFGDQSVSDTLLTSTARTSNTVHMRIHVAGHIEINHWNTSTSNKVHMVGVWNETGGLDATGWDGYLPVANPLMSRPLEATSVATSTGNSPCTEFAQHFAAIDTSGYLFEGRHDVNSLILILVTMNAIDLNAQGLDAAGGCSWCQFV